MINDDTHAFKNTYDIYTIHGSSIALSNEQQDCLLLDQDLGASLVVVVLWV